ncbi:MAG: hypothetical protein ABSB60_08200 [Terracidiphilus sp.]|jgi:hypothetical protein
MSLDIKQVIKVAREQFKELAPELPIEPQDLRLEEIEREGSNWALTFSVPNPNYRPESSFLGAAALMSGGYRASSAIRIAKVVVVDGNDGQFVALRQRAA